MKSTPLALVSLFLFHCLSPASAHAGDAGFDYPELSVVPLASDRLQREKEADTRERIWTHTTLLAPATLSFIAGAGILAEGTRSTGAQSDQVLKAAPWVSMGVGAIWWIAVGTWIHPQDEYGKGINEISSISGKTLRDQLKRERLAEESLRRAGSLARRMKWLSFASNLLSSGYLASSVKKDSWTVALAGASAIGSFIPLLFSHRWELTEDLQQEYKKRIYSPVAGPTLLMGPEGTSFVPGFSLAFRF
jgi:hypothetical protein